MNDSGRSPFLIKPAQVQFPGVINVKPVELVAKVLDVLPHNLPHFPKLVYYKLRLTANTQPAQVMTSVIVQNNLQNHHPVCVH